MRNRFSPSMRLVAAVQLALLAGCHVVEPLATAPVAEDEARVRFTELGAAMLAPLVGPGVTAVRGRILSIDSTSIRLRVAAVTDRDGLENVWLGEAVTVQRNQVAGFDRRVFSPVRSAFVAAGIAAGMFVMAKVASGDLGGTLSRIFGSSRQQ